jgi:DNA (cytosine-5)-methyltransferase 1
MSDIWGGNCSKQIGFTLRVGGRGSDINDRRNWDAYLVDGEIKRLGPIEGKKMMGFPDDFILHPVRTQAMKQLGNSVCPDVVYFVAQQVKQYLIKNTQRTAMLEPSNNFKLNKGEWSELYVFLYLLINNQLPFGSLLATPDADYVNVIKIKHPHTKTDYILNSGELEIVQLDNQQTQTINISTILNKLDLHDLLQKIQTTSATTFNLPELKFLLDKLTITQHFKANSATKGDLLISFAYQNMEVLEQSVGIKSYLGNPPTLLNSSSATNFIFELINFSDDMDKINQIATRSKIKDRILQIKLSSNGLKFIGCENSIHEDNLRKVDSKMPEILASILLSYYSGEASKLTEFNLTEQQIVRIKDYLKAIVLGMFSSTSWDGNYTAHGYILLQQQGDLLLYHVIKDKILKDYLFLNARLDTPSSTRHRFGTIYRENNSYYIKLNLQIRMLGK